MSHSDFLSKANSGRWLLDTLASLKLTVLLLILSMLLVLLGTFEQVHWGIWKMQSAYFSTWYCFYPVDPALQNHFSILKNFGIGVGIAAVYIFATYRFFVKASAPFTLIQFFSILAILMVGGALKTFTSIPLLGGFSIGALLIINLAFAHFRHYKADIKKIGISMIHGGLLLLLIGGFITAMCQEESAISITEGERGNYSEAHREFEIAIITKNSDANQVVVVPDGILRNIAAKSRPNEIALLGAPFTLHVQKYHPNTLIRAKSQMPDGIEVKVSEGIGATTAFAYKDFPEVFSDSEGNSPATIVEVKTKDKSLGTWILSPGISESFDAQTFTVDGKSYEISLRRKRTYLPFIVQLNKFTHEKFPGTEIPRRFASDVTIREGNSSFDFNISMNEPLRHAGLTLFQSSFGSTRDDKSYSVLQVVRNPGWLIPYIAVAIMTFGLFTHFAISLVVFIIHRSPKPVAIAKVAGLIMLGLASPNTFGAESPWDSLEFSHLPVQSGGRIIPVETLATGSLLQMRSRTSLTLNSLERTAFGQRPSKWTDQERKQIAKELPGLTAEIQAMLEKRPVRISGGAIRSVDWLLEVSFRAPVGRLLPTFRVEHPNVLKRVGGDPEKSLYVSFDSVIKNIIELGKAVEQARSRSVADRDAEDRALINLDFAIRQYASLSMTFIPGDLPADIAPRREYSAWINSISRALAEMKANQSNGGNGQAFDPELQKEVKNYVERYQQFERMGGIGIMPPPEISSSERWDNLGASLLGIIQDQRNHRPALTEDGLITRYADFAMAWREGKDDDCTSLTSSLAASLKGPWSTKTKAEASFSRLQAFYWLLIAYAFAVLFVFIYWLSSSEGLRVWTYRLLILLFILHTVALLYRMWLHGRPPVTNLYSSGIFIAWGAVALGIILEYVWKNGIGAAVAGLTGFFSLIVAHNLGLSGEDNLESVRAVLDSNFWLATHVTIVTLGYSATFVSGLLGALHLMLRAFKSDYTWGDSVARSAYGILAFALFASFTGTMLGGLWADQSWGRFWGWDPKENGAILIVLWCAVCLHARWGGLVRREGLMQLLIFGNIVTAWSWFGTNLLGVGLHSYGFTEKGALWLYWIFCPSQLFLIALGWLPERAKWAQLKL